MKVLSIKEPYASLILHNKKTIETRSWKTNYRGELYIHASQSTVAKEYYHREGLNELIKDIKMNYGHIICKCQLVDCIYMDEEYVRKMEKENPHEFVCGAYSVGRYAWVLENVEEIFPISAKGKLGIWNYDLKEHWLEEERIAHIKGWDFSHIEGKYKENKLPWDYKKTILNYLKNDMQLLDIDTAAGEFLLSLKHSYENTSATEAYPPNVKLCLEELIPLGINFKEAKGEGPLPFENEKFDIVINRHGSYNIDEIYRVLKKDGLFITQQVGAENDREFVELLLGKKLALPYPKQYLHVTVEEMKKLDMEIIEAKEAFVPMEFYDVGALVWFAKIIEWEFVGFNVEMHIDNLYKAQKILEKERKIVGNTHRYLIVAKKKGEIL